MQILTIKRQVLTYMQYLILMYFGKLVQKIVQQAASADVEQLTAGNDIVQLPASMEIALLQLSTLIVYFLAASAE